MLLVDRHIEIGRELRQQPCFFEVARQHYEKKATADEMVFAQYVTVVTTALHTTPLPAMSGSTDDPTDEAAREQIKTVDNNSGRARLTVIPRCTPRGAAGC
jgi:hypothetical protein